MLTIGNKQINLAHIAYIEWIDELVTAPCAETKMSKTYYAFRVHTSYGVVEQLLFSEETERKDKYDDLVDEMERLGY